MSPPGRCDVSTHDDHVVVSFSAAADPSAGAILHMGQITRGEATSGGGEDVGGENPLRVIVYRPSAVDPTSLDAGIAFGIEDGGTLALIAQWDSSIWMGQEITYSQESGFQARDLGAPSEVERYFVSTGMAPGAAHGHPAPLSGDPFVRLSVHGYRGFGDEATLELARPNGKDGSGLTVLVGANNSGKSTFLEALHLLARARRQSEFSIPQPQRHKATDRVQLDLERADGRLLRVASVRQGSSQASAEWHPTHGEPGQFAIQMTPARRVFSPYSGSMGTPDRDWNLNDGNFSRTQSRDSFLARLRMVDREPEARAVFDPLLEEIVGAPLNWTFDEIAPGQQFLKLIESDGSWHTSEGLGEGLISLLFIVDALYDSSPGSLIAIDEPELSLHPQLIRRLHRVLSRYAADRQILVATHSPLLVDWYDVAAGATIARTHKAGGRSVLSQVSRETLTRVAALGTSDNRFNPHTLGDAAREAFFLEDGILLLEGQEDVIYLDTVLDDLGLARFENTYGWGVGGVGNMPLLARMFVELGFTRIGALVDGDDHAGTTEAVRSLASMGPAVQVQQIPADDIRTKPRQKERQQKPGLLDETNGAVRPELAEDARAAIANLQRHLSPHPVDEAAEVAD